MSIETIISLLLNIPLGIISGLFAGLVVARYQRFADLRFQAKKVVSEIDFRWEGDHMHFPGRTETPEFSPIVSELCLLKHRNAADVVGRLTSEIYGSIQDAKMGRINSETFQERHLSWQHSIRTMAPNIFQLLRLWGGL